MWCLRCGIKDPGDNDKCSRCGNEIGPPDDRVGYFNQIMNLTNELLNGRISINDYERSIQWAAEAIDDMNKNIDPIRIELENNKFDEMSLFLLSKPLKSFEEGITVFQEGLENLRFYAYEQNQSHLQNGLSLLKKANNIFGNTTDITQYLIGDLSKGLSETDLAS